MILLWFGDPPLTWSGQDISKWNPGKWNPGLHGFEDEA
jgi:hypothetical protein